MSDDEPVYTPADFIRYTAESRNIPLESVVVPRRLLVTYQTGTYESARKLVSGTSVGWWMYGDAQSFCMGRFNDSDIGVGRLWIGAPAATMTLEELIACGAKTICEVGLCGGMQDFLKPGDIIVVTEAVRDEGVSFHYLPPEMKVEATPRLRELLVSGLKRRQTKHHSGPVWTTDGVYRETLGKFRKFKRAGVLGVNMETSAIFAVAKFRNVEAASAQLVSDVLTEEGWLQAWHDQSLKESREKLLECALEVLAES